ncbi:MAG TPA: hypothetical protein VKB81_04395 [Nitrospira sp.]|nr:hypothetical protein [Nitrospira sp.]
MKDLLDRYLLNPHWRTIKIVGQAKVLGISATTIIVAPLLSRILIKLNEMETSIKQAHPALDALFPLIKYQFELPLSIKLLVGSAVFALLGKGLYEWQCPVYIKAGDAYQQFRHSQARASEELAGAFLKIMRGDNKEKKGEMISGLHALNTHITEPRVPDTYQWQVDTTIKLEAAGRVQLPGPAAHIMRFPDVGESFFYVLRDVMDDSRWAARVACAVFYGAAFVLLSLALAMQLGWAVRGMLL